MEKLLVQANSSIDIKDHIMVIDDFFDRDDFKKIIKYIKDIKYTFHENDHGGGTKYFSHEIEKENEIYKLFRTNLENKVEFIPTLIKNKQIKPGRSHIGLITPHHRALWNQIGPGIACKFYPQRHNYDFNEGGELNFMQVNKDDVLRIKGLLPQSNRMIIFNSQILNRECPFFEKTKDVINFEFERFDDWVGATILT